MKKGKRNFDYKKRMNAKRRTYMKKITALATSFTLVSAPLAMPNTAPYANKVEAASFTEKTSLLEAKLLADVSIDANLVDADDHYKLQLGLTGTGLADAELLKPDRVGVFYIPELAGKISAEGPADIQVEILPINLKEDLPALYRTIGLLTGGVTTLVGEVTKTLDRIVGENGLLRGVVSIKGLDAVNKAINNLNNLDQALQDLTAYQDQVEVKVTPEGAVIVEFSDGLGNHLKTLLSDVVTNLVNDLLDAIAGLEIKVLEGVTDIPILGGIIDRLLNELVLNGIVSQLLGELTDLVKPLVKGVTDAVVNLSNKLVGAQVIGKTTINTTVRVDKPAGVSG